VSIRYTDRLLDAGIEPSVGSVGDSYDDALAETVIGLFKTEVIYRQTWRGREDVEWAVADWVRGTTRSGCWCRSATFPRRKQRRRSTPEAAVTPSRVTQRKQPPGYPGRFRTHGEISVSQEDIKADLTREALLLCGNRLSSGALPAPEPMLLSIKAQLEWLIEFYEGRSAERARLHQLTFGHLAAREIEDSDPELARALHRAYYAASRTAAGLKLELSVLGLEA